MNKFSNKYLSELNLEQRTELFSELLDSINASIKKAMLEFHPLPLEYQDLLFYAWLTFQEILNKSKTKKFKAELLLKVLGAIRSKCVEVCAKSIKNCYKKLNFSIATCSLSYKKPNKDTILDSKSNITIQEIVDTYFENTNEKLAKQVFEMYENIFSQKEICETLDISKNKFNIIIKNTICDLQKTITLSLK
ncbi:hypothetical protein V2P43_00085 [Mycoplasma capricolum subsp. capricolum]|uniref:hypothetical protein n=1 Tax=Mycoplasma capricolum TaxID=2095 RepID=UPI003DA3E46F